MAAFKRNLPGLAAVQIWSVEPGTRSCSLDACKSSSSNEIR
jgi:hypothetical protein